MRGIASRSARSGAPEPGGRPADIELVTAARSGDARAQGLLLRAYLPLVYNVVGRALPGHPDVDDVVQETMLRAIRSLPRLREPARFRSWLIAIAIRQTHDHGRRVRSEQLHVRPLTEQVDPADPTADFAALTIDRQALARAGAELAQASRWIGAEHSRTLSLWWQEAAGQLTRAEVAQALEVTVPHAAVRIQRMKAKLQLAIDVLAARRASPPCTELNALMSRAEAGASGRLLTRLGRHVEGCPVCQASVRERASVDELPIRIGALAVPVALAAGIPGLVARHAARSAGAGLLHVLRLRHVLVKPTAKVVAIGSAATLTAAVGLAVYVAPRHSHPATSAAHPATGAPNRTTQAAGRPTPTASQSTNSAYSGVASADFYVATDGSDANTGTLTEPFATLTRALKAAVPGQTVAVRGGTYRPTAPITLGAGGTADHQITISNYRDEQPVLDGSAIPVSDWFISQTADYLTVQGLAIENAPGPAYVCESCHDDAFTRLALHDNGRAGLQLFGAGTHDDLVLDSDFFDNHEAGPSGGYADGLSFPNGSGTGNRIQGCRMYDNSGDGADLSGFHDAVALDHDWSFGNGVNRWSIARFSGGGSGFKLGGGANGGAGDTATQSAAWDNAGFGFTEDGNAGTPRMTEDTAFRNGAAGFAFLASAAVLGDDLAVANHPDSWLGPNARHTNDSWDESAWSAAELDLDGTAVTAARSLDGQLPATRFLDHARSPGMGAAL